MNRPRNAKEARQITARASFQPNETLLLGAVVCTLMSLLFWFLIFQNRDLFNLVITFVVTFGILGYAGLRQIPTAQHGVITMFGRRIFEGNFLRGEKAILGDGTHWLFPFISDAIIVDTRERSIDIPDATMVVPDPNNGQNGISVIFSGARVSIIVYNPFSIIETGGIDDVSKDIIKSVLEVIRDEANNPEAEVSVGKKGPIFIFSADINLRIETKLRNEEDGERWGITILSAKTPQIQFANPKTGEAFEKSYVESREKEAEEIQTQTLLKNVASIMAASGNQIPYEKAWEISQRISKLYGNDIVITNNGGTDIAAMIIAATKAAEAAKKPE